MAQKAKPDQTKVIIDAALSHADKVGWDALTIKDIAKKAKLKEEDVLQRYATPWHILGDVLISLDTRTAETAGELMGEEWRDNLFEILMTRFDLIEEHRGAFESLKSSFLRAPDRLPCLARTYGNSMHAMLSLAGAGTTPLHVMSFGALYLSLIDAWKNDETPDLSKTMAAIDKRLDLFERLCDKAPFGARGAA